MAEEPVPSLTRDSPPSGAVRSSAPAGPPGPDPDSVASASTGAAPPRDPALAASRRTFGALLLGALGVGVLCLLDHLPALYAGVVLAHLAIVWRWRRRAARRVPGEVRVSPTPVGVVVLVLLWVLVLIAVFVPSPSFRLLACVTFSSACLAWPLAAANLARLAVERRLPARARAESRTLLEVSVRNPTRREVESVYVAEEPGLGVRPASVEFRFERVPAMETATETVSLVFQRRGRRRLRPARISSAFPLGLFVATRDVEAPVEVIVHPREGAATRALRRRLRGTAASPAAVRAARDGSDEFHGLREHRDGDDPRRIHWKTSARRGAPTFVVRRDPPARRIVVALAACRSRDRAAEAAFERAVSATATVLRAALDDGCHTTLVLSSSPTPEGRATFTLRGPGDLSRALDALAVVRADGKRDPRAVFVAGSTRSHGATVVWVSSTPEGASEAPGAAEGVSPRDRIRLRADESSLARHVTGLT